MQERFDRLGLVFRWDQNAYQNAHSLWRHSSVRSLELGGFSPTYIFCTYYVDFQINTIMTCSLAPLYHERGTLELPHFSGAIRRISVYDDRFCYERARLYSFQQGSNVTLLIQRRYQEVYTRIFHAVVTGTTIKLVHCVRLVE